MNVAADYLSGGEQQMAAVARALSGNVKLLLLDEPFEGLAPSVVQELPIDGDGIDVDALRHLHERRPLRAVYLTPHHQYPTTVTLKAARRIDILAWRRSGMAIIEDDYDHEFHYDGRPVLPLASADRAGLVVYIGTLSKILAPGLRVGYIVAPPALISRIAAIRSLLDIQGDLATEAAIAKLIEDGELQRHVARVRRVTRAVATARSSAAADILSDAVEFTLADRRHGDVGPFRHVRRLSTCGRDAVSSTASRGIRAADMPSTSCRNRLRDSASPG